MGIRCLDAVHVWLEKDDGNEFTSHMHINVAFRIEDPLYAVGVKSSKCRIQILDLGACQRLDQIGNIDRFHLISDLPLTPVAGGDSVIKLNRLIMS